MSLILQLPLASAADGELLAQLSQEQREYLKNKQVIWMPTYSNWRPFNYLEAGQPKGYLIDLTRQISQKLGLELRFVNGFDWSQHMEKLADGQIDVIGNMVLTEERQKHFLFSEQPTLELLTGLISLKGYTQFKDLTGVSVGIQKDSVFEGYFKNQYPNVTYQEYLSLNDMMAALLNGKIDLFVENYSIANYLINVTHTFNDDLQVRLLESESRLKLNMHFAFNQQDPMLSAIFDKAYASISQDDIQALQELWGMVPYQHMDLSTSKSLKNLLYVLIVTFGMLLLLFYRYRLLSEQSAKIARINEQLEGERLELERVNRAYASQVAQNQSTEKLSQDYLRALKQMGNMFAVIGVDSLKVIDADDMTAQWWGYNSAQEVIGRTVPDLMDISPEFAREFHLEAKRKGIAIRIQRQLRPSPGIDAKVGEICLIYRPAKDGEEAHTIRLMRDVSEELALRQALTEKAEEAVRLSRIKSEFLANMSHEIRTPMNAVLTLAKTLASSRESNEKTVMQAGKILRAGQSLQNLLDDILDFSKIESGKLKLVISDFYLSDLLETLAILMSSAAKDKSIHLAITPKYRGDIKLSGDQQRLEQILINLISNAIKFTSSGYVELTIELVDVEPVSRLRFSVRDTGIGMNESVLARIFNPFEQGDGSITRKFGGTGLGLTITQQLLSMMSGELNIESKEFRGTTVSFEIAFPIEVVATTPVAESWLLIACKNPFTRNSLAAVADSVGLNYEVGQTERFVVHTLVSAIKEERFFDLVLYDGEISGRGKQHLESFVRDELESLGLEWHGRFVSVDSPIDSIDDAESSPSESLQEPVTPAALRHISVARTGEETPSLQTHRLEGVSLLVVDDNQFNCDAAREFLEAAGSSVKVANNGSEAIKILRAAGTAIDLVFMDVQMPVMDGIEATQRLRAMTRFKQLPIVGLSAGAYPQDIEVALNAGMNAYITKPVDIDSAISKIVELLSLDSSDEESSSTGENKRAPEQLNCYFDRLLARDYWSSDEMVKKYVLSFIEQYGEILESLDVGSAELNYEFVHKIKGATSLLGMPKLTDALSLLEVQLRNRQSVSAVEVFNLVAVWTETQREAKHSLQV
ncbi:ATP-binding protein [Marinobacterium sp. LSUCC0821]|uniref:ATP-binding protein n=1 Tax=Marinobacterium sp. LSUCC0821 TaxID=2668067 RepID=UPI00145207BE|nr:transporter substrate-binding domain-containing protein [Marinobacterium sp. LSUCC0821]QJD71408.1 transporter substrate-binding domain-containing protein [Marinobacterium sp. LSUCC0821]